MPEIAAHTQKAAENEHLVTQLQEAELAYYDWMVTGLFYSALHHVSALLHQQGCADSDIDRHGKRLAQLCSRLPDEEQLHDDYRQLKDDSEEARYECAVFSADDVGQLRADQFARLRARVLELLT